MAEQDTLDTPSPHIYTNSATIHGQISSATNQKLMEMFSPPRGLENQTHQSQQRDLRPSLARHPVPSAVPCDQKETPQLPASPRGGKGLGMCIHHPKFSEGVPRILASILPVLDLTDPAQFDQPRENGGIGLD